MKKILITTIIFINLGTLYFWIFPYQGKQDMYAFKLAEKTLKRQCEIIGTGAESTIRAIDKEAEAYPQVDIYLEKAKTLHQLSKANYEEIQHLRNEIAVYSPKKYFFTLYSYPDEAFGLFNRIRPFQYQAPKKAMDKHLANTCDSIKANQNAILNLIENDSFRQVLTDSFLVDVDGLPRLLKKVSVIEAFSLLAGIQTQVKVAEYRALEHLLAVTSNITDNGANQGFVPIVHANTSNLKLGDTYEAEVFAAAYLNNSQIKAYADGKEIPVKDGIAYYTVKPTSVGKKTVNVSMAITNPLTKETKSYRRDFEYDVVDCD